MKKTAFIALLAVASANKTASAQADAEAWHRFVAGIGAGAGSRSIVNPQNGRFIKTINAEVGVRLTNRFGINYEFRRGLVTADEGFQFHLATVDWFPLFDRAPNFRVGASGGIATVHARPFTDGFHDDDIRGSVPAVSVSAALDRYGEVLTFSPFVNVMRTFGQLSSVTCLKGTDPNALPTLSNCVNGHSSGIMLAYVGVALSIR
jgi:hypothetical protein